MTALPDRSPDRNAVRDRIRVRHTSSACVVHVSGDIDVNVAAELRAGLAGALAAYPTVVVDLGGADRIDSVGLGALVRARNEAWRRHGEVLLAEPSRFVRTVLRTMRLHTAFRIFGSVEQAIVATRRTSVSSAGLPG